MDSERWTNALRYAGFTLAMVSLVMAMGFLSGHYPPVGF